MLHSTSISASPLLYRDDLAGAELFQRGLCRLWAYDISFVVIVAVTLSLQGCWPTPCDAIAIAPHSFTVWLVPCCDPCPLVSRLPAILLAAAAAAAHVVRPVRFESFIVWCSLGFRFVFFLACFLSRNLGALLCFPCAVSGWIHIHSMSLPRWCVASEVIRCSKTARKHRRK